MKSVENAEVMVEQNGERSGSLASNFSLYFPVFPRILN